LNDLPDLVPATCPRCGESFGCGAASEKPCVCTRIRLTDTLRAELRERYSGCLCPRCLVALGGLSLDGPVPGPSAVQGR